MFERYNNNRDLYHITFLELEAKRRELEQLDIQKRKQQEELNRMKKEQEEYEAKKRLQLIEMEEKKRREQLELEELMRKKKQHGKYDIYIYLENSEYYNNNINFLIIITFLSYRTI